MGGAEIFRLTLLGGLQIDRPRIPEFFVFIVYCECLVNPLLHSEVKSNCLSEVNMPETFSERGGYQAPDVEITIREDAPRELRNAILMIAQNLNMPPQYMRHVACSALLKRPDPSNWSYTNVWNEVNDLIENCPWNKVYDIAEQLYEGFSRLLKNPAWPDNPEGTG